jgi:F-type H+-transporting ATPase subunit delta
MSFNTKTSGRVGELYAQTLFELSLEREVSTPTKEEMDSLQVIFAAEKEFWGLLCSPYFTPTFKIELLEKVFSGRLSELTLDFLKVTIKHGRIRYLPDMNASFIKLWDNYHGSVPIKVVLSEKMEDEWGTKFSDEMASILKRKITLEVALDPSIIGGIIIRYADKVVDNTIRTRLQNLVTSITSSNKRWVKQNEIRLD